MQNDNPISEKDEGISPLVFLVGFMGAGKTTVGRELASKLRFQFLDLDDLIEAKTNKSIKEIFSEFGELRFRELESEAIQACATESNTIIALGGGAYVRETNRQLLREIGDSIWLDCPIEICLARIESDGSRPLASTKESMRALYLQRLAAYGEADYKVRITADQNPGQIAEAIIKLLGWESRSR